MEIYNYVHGLFLAHPVGFLATLVILVVVAAIFDEVTSTPAEKAADRKYRRERAAELVSVCKPERLYRKPESLFVKPESLSKPKPK